MSKDQNIMKSEDLKRLVAFPFEGQKIKCINSVGFLYIQNCFVLNIYVDTFPSDVEFEEIDDIFAGIIAGFDYIVQHEFSMSFTVGKPQPLSIEEIVW